MRLIDADALLMKLDMTEDLSAYDVIVCEEMVNEQPTIDAELVKHGHWVQPYHDHYKQCSVCERIHYTIPWNAAYCPFCGAKMDGGDL